MAIPFPFLEWWMVIDTNETAILSTECTELLSVVGTAGLPIRKTRSDSQTSLSKTTGRFDDCRPST
jgi:hypothetical protein